MADSKTTKETKKSGSQNGMISIGKIENWITNAIKVLDASEPLEKSEMIQHIRDWNDRLSKQVETVRQAIERGSCKVKEYAKQENEKVNKMLERVGSLKVPTEKKEDKTPTAASDTKTWAQVVNGSSSSSSSSSSASSSSSSLVVKIPITVPTPQPISQEMALAKGVNEPAIKINSYKECRNHAGLLCFCDTTEKFCFSLNGVVIICKVNRIYPFDDVHKWTTFNAKVSRDLSGTFFHPEDEKDSYCPNNRMTYLPAKEKNQLGYYQALYTYNVGDVNNLADDLANATREQLYRARDIFGHFALVCLATSRQLEKH